MPRQNPTAGGATWFPRFLRSLDHERCTNCGFCRKICPGGVFGEGPDHRTAILSPGDCWGCTVCARMCKARALTLDDENPGS